MPDDLTFADGIRYAIANWWSFSRTDDDQLFGLRAINAFECGHPVDEHIFVSGDRVPWREEFARIASCYPRFTVPPPPKVDIILENDKRKRAKSGA